MTSLRIEGREENVGSGGEEGGLLLGTQAMGLPVEDTNSDQIS